MSRTHLAATFVLVAVAMGGLHTGLGLAEPADQVARPLKLSSAAGSATLRFAGRWHDGPVFAAAVAGKHVFFGSGGMLRVLEIGDEKTWKEIASITTPGVIRGLIASGEHLFVSDEGGALRIFDVSNPKQPKQVGYSELPKNTRAVFVRGHYAYLAAGWKGLAVVDISNVRRPRVVSFTKTPDIALDVFVSGSIALVANNRQGIRLIDVSDPLKPRDVGHHDLPGYT